jgi:DNA-binding CsgD family transcriptional regulator/PAS domain-containing protein
MAYPREFELLLDQFNQTAGLPGDNAFLPFLKALNVLFQSHIACLHFHDFQHHTGSMALSVGVPSEEQARYTARAAQNLWIERGGPQLLASGIADDRDLTTDQELEASEFYEVQLKPLDIRHSLGLCLWKGAERQLATVTISRDAREGYFSEQELRSARQLLPCAQAAYLLYQHLSWIHNTTALFRHALDRLYIGVILVNRRGRTVFVNERAQAFSASLIGSSAKVGARSDLWPSDASRFQEVIERACCGGADAIQQECLVLRDRCGRPSFMLRAFSVPSTTSLAWGEPSVAALLFVNELSRPAAADVKSALRGLGLSKAEANLALMIGEGLTPQEASEQLGRNIATIRSQLRAAYAKTQTRRQAELVKFISALKT